MSKAYLGSGWKFPITVNDHGKVAEAQYEDSVRDAIWIILSTAKGERMMRPDFGCGIQEMVFEISSPGTAGRVASEVREALIQWEPRIDVQDVSANFEGQGEVLLVNITYEVRATNNVFNLVYPFYLNASVTG